MQRQGCSKAGVGHTRNALAVLVDIDHSGTAQAVTNARRHASVAYMRIVPGRQVAILDRPEAVGQPRRQGPIHEGVRHRHKEHGCMTRGSCQEQQMEASRTSLWRLGCKCSWAKSFARTCSGDYGYVRFCSAGRMPWSETGTCLHPRDQEQIVRGTSGRCTCDCVANEDRDHAVHNITAHRHFCAHLHAKGHLHQQEELALR